MDEIQLLKKLIQIPSYSGYEKKLAMFIVDYCKNNNLDVQTQNGDVIVRIKGRNKTKALIFTSHMDTVSIGNKAKWKYPPYGKKAGKIADGKIYGLGASDDKAAVTAMMLLAKSVNNPPCDLWFTFVCNEETDGSGTEKFLQWFKKSKYKQVVAVIGEPTNLKTLEIGHRGNAFIRLISYGVTGHGAKKYSRNELAVEKMVKAISKIQKDFLTWKKKYKHHILGEPNLNITGLHTTEEFVNKLPDKCWATLDIRTTPDLHKEMDKLLEVSVGKLVEISKMKGDSPPGFTGNDSQIVKVCKKILPNLSFSVSLGTTDFSQFIQAGIDAVVLGPGEKRMIHRENEYVKLEEVNKAINIYKKIIFTFAS
jgi:acetylornithine deacetylase/succinyl-diaminopimelate desuccinylase-like protein